MFQSLNKLCSVQRHQLQDSPFHVVGCAGISFVDVPTSLHIYRESWLVSALW